MPKITIPTIDKHSSVAGLAIDLQPVLDQLAVAFPDVFIARDAVVVADIPTPAAGPAVADTDVPVTVVKKPKRAPAKKAK